MSILLIVESPGKIKKISEYLGDEYIVSASVGHIIDLNESSMSINLETFEPEYKIYDNKKDVVSKLVKLALKVGKENVKNTISESGNKLLYTIPYHPRLNSIEQWFNQLKHYIKQDKPTNFNL